MQSENDLQTAEFVPATFRDALERDWELDLHYSLAKRIRKVTTLDFVNFHDGKALMTIQEDVEKLVQVLWLFCAAQAGERQVDEESFGEGLGGDALERAVQALEQALINFSRPAMRPALEAISKKTSEVLVERSRLVMEKVNSPKFDQAISRKMEKISEKIDREIEKASMSGN